LTYSLAWHEKALKDLKRIDRQQAGRIVERMAAGVAADPRGAGKPLKGKFGGLFRFRWGDYRIIYRIDKEEKRIEVLLVDHRKQVYRKLERLKKGDGVSEIRAGYDAWADGYDEQVNRTRDLDGDVTRKVLAGRRLGHVLEAGCGTGKNTPFYAGIGDKVTAFDFSAGMLARARTIPGLDNVTFLQADLGDTWPAAENSVDLAACNLVLEHLEDLDAVFSRAARVLVPGGTFYISELHPFRQCMGVKAKRETPSGEREIPAFVHHVSDFFSAAEKTGFHLDQIGEWFHPDDEGKPPRLITFLFCLDP
jgi:malonyl-CoA O-methyltransferase